MLRTLLLGAPGAGKGTQATRLRSMLGFTVLASGDVLRAEMASGSSAGRTFRRFVDRGQLVPDALVEQLLLRRIDDVLLAPCAPRWVLDGFPRSVPQAHTLAAFLANRSSPLHAVFNLDVPHSVLLERIQNRWMHPASGRTYNLSFNPPRTPGLDDVTGEPLVKRSDDSVDTYRRRLETYARDTEPLINHYQQQGLLVNFTGATSDEIWPQLRAYVEGHLAQQTDLKALHPSPSPQQVAAVESAATATVFPRRDGLRGA